MAPPAPADPATDGSSDTAAGARATGPVVDRWRWPRRLAMASALALAIAFCISAVNRVPDRSQVQRSATDAAVVRQSPEPGSHVLHQSQVGVELQPGYDGRITIDGTEIPEDQMDGVAPVDSPAYAPEYGIRPNNKNRVFYTPGEGKVVERYQTGEVHISVRFWPIAEGEGASKTIAWAFFVN